MCGFSCVFELFCWVNAFPQTEYTKPFSPDCTIRCHITYPLSVKSFLNVAHVCSFSAVWILKWSLMALWLIKLLLHTEHWWGRSLACILECLTKAPFCVKCTPHVWHKCGFCPVCVLTWLSIFGRVVKTFPLTEHMCASPACILVCWFKSNLHLEILPHRPQLNSCNGCQIRIMFLLRVC
jgi:hypothetical protein